MSKMYAKNSFDRFGDDFCQYILSYLSLEERFEFECISKQWQRVVFRSQTSLTIDGFNAQRLISKIFPAVQLIPRVMSSFELILLSLKRLIKPKSGHKYDWRIFNTILKKCTNISTINLKKFCFEDIAIRLSIKHCSQLTHIYVNFETISVKTIDKFFAKFGPQLKTLKVFSFNKSVDKKSIEKWLEMCVNLQSMYAFCQSIPSLTLQSVTESGLTFNGLNAMDINLYYRSEDMDALDVFADQYGHRMKTLKLALFWTNYKIIPEVVVRLTGILPRMRSLVSFKLRLPWVSAEQLIPLFAEIGLNCRRLKSLNFTINEWTPELIDTICEHFMGLTRLKIWAFSCVANTSLTSDSLSPLEALTHLDLYINYHMRYHNHNYSYFTDQFFANIDHNLPNLRYLKLKYVKITEKSLISLSGLRQIRGITLEGIGLDKGRDRISDANQMAANDIIANYPKISAKNVNLI